MGVFINLLYALTFSKSSSHPHFGIFEQWEIGIGEESFASLFFSHSPHRLGITFLLCKDIMIFSPFLPVFF